MLQSDYIEATGERIPHYYLCHYKPLSSGFDLLSKSLIGFKNRNPIDLEAWTSCAVESLSHLSLSHPLILRALHSQETQVSDYSSSLDHLGISLTDSLSWPYLPSSLTKSHTTLPLKQLSRVKREKELIDVYSFTPPNLSFESILLIDDIITTGITIGAIVRSVRKIRPHVPIVSFTLASTDSMSRLNDVLPLKSATYSWSEEVGWNVAEAVPHGIAVNALIESIRCNFSNPE
jgi:predicted amidophosphoribosyltransferase